MLTTTELNKKLCKRLFKDTVPFLVNSLEIDTEYSYTLSSIKLQYTLLNEEHSRILNVGVETSVLLNASERTLDRVAYEIIIRATYDLNRLLTTELYNEDDD